MIDALGMIAMCASWLLPGHYFPWGSFQQDSLAAIGAALIALAAIVSTDLRRLAVARTRAGRQPLLVFPGGVGLGVLPGAGFLVGLGVGSASGSWVASGSGVAFGSRVGGGVTQGPRIRPPQLERASR